MAEIRVEPRPPRAWPWLAGIASLAAVIWLLAAATAPEPVTQLPELEAFELEMLGPATSP